MHSIGPKTRNPDTCEVSDHVPSQSRMVNDGFSGVRFGVVVFFIIFLGLLSFQAVAEKQPPALVLSAEEREWLAQAPEITVATRYGWAPIEFMSEGGEIRGISMDYLQRIASILGLKLRLQGSAQSLANETADILSATYKTPALTDSRFQIIQPPFIATPFVIYSKKEGVHYKSLAELKGKKVAAFKTGTVSRMLAQDYPSIKLYPADIAEEALEALLTGKADAYIGNPSIVNYVAQSQGMATIVISGETPYQADIHMAVRNDWPLLASSMSKALAAIYAQDRAEIMGHWESVSYAYDLNYPLIFSILLSAALITGFFYAANRRLNKEVSKRIRTQDSLIKSKEKAETAEQTIREYAKEVERMALVATKTLNAVIITDGEGLTTWVNPAFTRITGFSFEDIRGKKPGHLLQGPDTAQASVEYMRQSIRQRQDCVLELINYKKNGEKFWVNLSIASIENSQGEHIFIAVQNDITNQKNFIEYIECQRADMDAMFSLNPDGIVLIGPDSHVTQVNRAFMQLTGLQTTSLIGLHVDQLDEQLRQHCNDPEQYVSLRDDLDTLQESESNALNALTRQMEISSDPFRVLSRSFVSASQPRVKGVFYFRDITQETLVKRMKTEFITTAAHELRTPMSVILGYAELLNHKKQAEEIRREMLQAILQKSNSVVELLNDLLDIAKIEDRTTKVLRLELGQIEPLLQSIAETFITSRNQNHVQLTIKRPLPPFYFDAQKMERAINNCLSNAYKFSSNSSQVYMRAEHIQNATINEISISIIDAGIGMKPDQLARIFEKFYRADQSGNIPGTGLGMVLVKEIIEAHGGWVEVESVYCVGTTVTLHLPVTETLAAIRPTQAI
jgi:PAS domain S-box-containing protein